MADRFSIACANRQCHSSLILKQKLESRKAPEPESVGPGLGKKAASGARLGGGTAPLDPDGPSKKNATAEGTSGRDVEYEFAVSELESMRIPGTSDYATIQTYNTLKRMGLKSVDVQPETMKRALSAMMAPSTS